MKRICVLIMATLLISISLCGCIQEHGDAYSKAETSSESKTSQAASENISSAFPSVQSEPTSTSDLAQENPTQGKILIAYFTWAENVENDSDIDATASASVSLPGNVGQMADWIQDEICGDLFSIQVTEPYSCDYDECLDRAAEEKAQNARPELKNGVENFTEYDIIFIGYPNWWYTAPMAVFSFLEQYDLSGKRVVPFCSHGTGGLASSVNDIAAELPDSMVENNVIGVYRDDVSNSRDTVKYWLKEIGF
ncbi:MAG: flavodoxin [Oscillospiraceae bacterium]|nr:flavodoxin [Oscillospiraceae bacterium]